MHPVSRRALGAVRNRLGGSLRSKPRAMALVALLASPLIASACSSTSSTGSASVAGTASASSAKCTSYQTVNLDIFPSNLVSLDAWIMEDEGFLKKNCLVGNNVKFTSGPAAAAAAVSGTINFLELSEDTAYAPRTQGVDMQIVAGMSRQVFYQLVVPKGSPLAKESATAVIKSLQGKEIGVNGLKNSTYYMGMSNVLAAGLSPSAVNFVALGTPTAEMAALQYHQVPAEELSGTLGVLAVASGVGEYVPSANFSNLGQPGVGNSLVKNLQGASLVWVGYGPWLKSHNTVVQEFVKASAEAIAWAKNPANHAAVVAIADKYAPVSLPGTQAQKAQTSIVDTYLSGMSSTQTLAGMQGWADYAYKVGELPRKIDVNHAIYAGTRSSLLGS